MGLDVKEYLVPMITLVAGGLVGMMATYVSAKQKFREDLQAKYDETLHNTRIDTYQKLWSQLQVLAKYARPEVVTPKRLNQLAGELRKWYFETGGLFLTDSSRFAYEAVQKAIVAELEKNEAADKELDGPALETIWKIGSNLRTALSNDLRSRRQPRV